jgi:hypothetical protein
MSASWLIYAGRRPLSLEDQTNPPSLLGLIVPKGVTTDKKDVDLLLLEALDDVLDDLLGKQVREKFYDHMERNYYIGREDIPRRLGDFLLILERTFCKSGKTIERTLARRLCAKLS